MVLERCATYLERAYYEFELCFVPAGTSGTESLFGVSDYLAALALLLVIYTISDYRNKLRLSLAPVPIYKLGFWLFLFVFGAKALIELWFYQGWPLFPSLDNRLLFDAVLLAPCVVAVLYWVYVSYIRPPVFSRWNSRKFFWIHQKVVHNGTAEELRITLLELARSARAIIKCASQPPMDKTANWRPSRTEGAAHDFLLLLGNRRLCSEMARTSPDTAAAFFHEISEQGKFGLPYGTFAKNVAAALLTDKSSPIFDEDSGWESGWSGYAQLYSTEIFANPKHITSLAQRHSSPLDLRHTIIERWDAENWEAYTRVALLYFEQIVQDSPHLLTDFSVNGVFETCESMASGIHRLNGAEGSFFQTEEYQKLDVLTDFSRNLIKLLAEYDVSIPSSLKPENPFDNGFHEELAELNSLVIFSAASVRQPTWTCWSITHNMVWRKIFGFENSETSRWIFRRVCRLIYAEIRDMDSYFNFKGAAYLGFCLNVLGLDDKRHRNHRKEEAPLRLAVLAWTRKNYSRMRNESPKVAETCLHGSITFDEKTNELVKTYANETSDGPTEHRFKVDPA